MNGASTYYTWKGVPSPPTTSVELTASDMESDSDSCFVVTDSEMSDGTYATENTEYDDEEMTTATESSSDESDDEEEEEEEEEEEMREARRHPHEVYEERLNKLAAKMKRISKMTVQLEKKRIRLEKEQDRLYEDWAGCIHEGKQKTNKFQHLDIFLIKEQRICGKCGRDFDYVERYELHKDLGCDQDHD